MLEQHRKLSNRSICFMFAMPNEMVGTIMTCDVGLIST
jgi:hypothetical protein